MTDLELRVILIEAKDLLFKSRDTDERGLRRYRCPLGAAKICALLFGPVEQSTAQLLDTQLPGNRRVRVTRPYSVVRPADHHRRPPRIGAEEPVDGRLLVLAEALIACHPAIQHRLRREGRHQIVRAPDEWNADAKAVMRAGDHGLEAVSIILLHLALDAGA